MHIYSQITVNVDSCGVDIFRLNNDLLSTSHYSYMNECKCPDMDLLKVNVVEWLSRLDKGYYLDELKLTIPKRE